MTGRIARRALVPLALVVGVLARLALQPLAADEVIDRVVAVVEGDLIMQSDVNAVRTLGLSWTSSGAASDDVVSQLIDRALVLSEIERYSPPEPTPAAIDVRVRAVRERFSSPETFGQALARVGFSEQRLRQTLRQDLRIDAYLQQRFTTPMPTDDELNAYYQTHREEFADGGRQLTVVEARDRIDHAVRQARHASLVAEWVAGLRRRASIMRVSASNGG